MTDADEAAAIVNALQRHCTIAVQKSFAEGFGLTVAEAMWKSRPVVASAVGGIVDQVVDGETGLLVDDPPTAPRSRTRCSRCSATRGSGAARRERTRARDRAFLGDRHLEQWAALLATRDVAAPAPVVDPGS